MSRLIFEPTVKLIARPELDREALGQWAKSMGLLDVLQTPGTPLNLLVGMDHLYHDRDGEDLVEFAGRQCYRSFKKGRPHDEYIENIISEGHGSVLEHANYSFAVAGVSRSFSLELIRHRAGVAISQESQRYVDANDIKFVVAPLYRQHLRANPGLQQFWQKRSEDVLLEYAYRQGVARAALLERGLDPEDPVFRKRINEAARSCLPNETETRYVWTANLRTLRHVCTLRGSPHADLEIRDVAVKTLEIMKYECPAVFDDMGTADEDIFGPMVSTMHTKV